MTVKLYKGNESLMADYKIKDSGEHRDFPTGAHRDKKTGKGRYDLLPPRVIHALAVHFQKGADKYDERNWEKGLPLGEFFDSALRHAFQFLQGETDENHLIAAIWNLVCLYDTKLRIEEGLLPKELDNLPKKTEETHEQIS